MNAITTPRPVSATDDSLLRLALRADATGTGLCGLGMLVLAGPVARLTGLTATHIYIAAAALVAYGVIVFGLARLPRVVTAGKWVIDANLLCTVGAVTIVATGVLPLTTGGVLITLAMGVYTAAFATLQYLGVRRLA